MLNLSNCCRYFKKLSDKKPDGLITLSGGVVKAVIEYKTSNELSTNSKIAKAIKQELEVAKFLCKLLIVTDGTKTFWINALNGEEIKRNGGIENDKNSAWSQYWT